MTAANHALAGVAIALAVKQPLLAVPLAFGAHFVMDAIPHFPSSLNSLKVVKAVIFIDTIVASSLTIGLSISLKTNVSGWLIFASALACMSPDLVWGWRLYKLKNLRKVILEPMSPFSRFHTRIQWGNTHLGTLMEVIWFVSMAWLIRNLVT